MVRGANAISMATRKTIKVCRSCDCKSPTWCAQCAIRDEACPSLSDQVQKVVSLAVGLRRSRSGRATSQPHSWVESDVLAGKSVVRQHALAVPIQIWVVDALAVRLFLPYCAFAGVLGARLAVSRLAIRLGAEAPVGLGNLSHYSREGVGHGEHALLYRRVENLLGLSHRNNLAASRPNSGGRSDWPAPLLRMISTVGPRGEFRFTRHAGGVTAEVFREVLKRSKIGQKAPVCAIVDRRPMHKTSAAGCSRSTLYAADQTRMAVLGAFQASGVQAPHGWATGDYAIYIRFAQVSTANGDVG